MYNLSIFLSRLGFSQHLYVTGMLSEVSAQAWPELALACGRVTEALEAIELGTASHPESVALCSQAITFAAQTALQVSLKALHRVNLYSAVGGH